MHAEGVVVTVACILAGGVAAQWLGWRLRVPAIVFLLMGGLLAGPIGGALDPDETFGDLLFPAVSLFVAVILFEGALGLGWRGVRAAGSTVWLLLTVGATVTAAGTAIAGHYILDVSWNLAILIASVLVVTGPTVIGPILKAIGLRGQVGAILESEGTLIDPIGAIMAVVVFQALFISEGESTGQLVSNLVRTLGIGGVVGVVAAGLLVLAFSRYLVPDQLHNATTLAAVISAFAVANAFREESGLVAVTVMGFALASQSNVPVRHVLEFNETLRILFISGLFVLLGARIQADTLRAVEWQNIAFLAVLVVVVRPLSAALSTVRSGLSRRERLFIALTAPRGIVAAAIASIYSLELTEIGVDDSQILVSATFTVIMGTVLASGLSSRWLAGRLGLLEDQHETILVLGSNPVSRELAAALEKQGASVRLLDLDRRELAAARMTGLPVQHGSVLADQTWTDAGLASASSFVALTANDELNILAARHAASVLGRRRVFQIPPNRPEHEGWWNQPIGTFARPLFANDTNIRALTDRLEQGWRVTATRLTERFGADDHAARHPDAIRLFTVDSKGHVDLSATDAPRRLRLGDTVVSLTPADERRKAVQEPAEPEQ